MKNIIVGTLFLSGLLVSCKPSTKEAESVQQETLKVHDEIMPMISSFDQRTVRIDSLLGSLPALKAQQADLDTSSYRQELTGLKTQLEGATNQMMDWMLGYVADSLQTEYQQQELAKVKAMKTVFDKVEQDSKTILK